MRVLYAAVIGLTALLTLGLVPGTAYAQAGRTWISGTGLDSNNCSRTAPCLTFVGAYMKTATYGEINCIDSGGFGALTITRSITINCTGVEGGVLSGGTNGFVISAAPTDVVVIKGLDFQGQGPNALSLDGIRIINAGNVLIDDCTITEYDVVNGLNGNGIFINNTSNTQVTVINSRIANNAYNGIAIMPQANASVTIKNTVITNNGVTIGIGGAIYVQPASGSTANVTLANVAMSGNGLGLKLDGTLGGIANAEVTDSVATSSSFPGFSAVTTSGAVAMMLNHAVSSFNNVGVRADGAAARVILGSSVVTRNNTGIVIVNGATMQSYNNNQIDMNTTDANPALPPTIATH